MRERLNAQCALTEQFVLTGTKALTTHGALCSLSVGAESVRIVSGQCAMRIELIAPFISRDLK